MKCVYCGSGTDLTKEHVPPKSLLRKNFPAGLRKVSACWTCNNGFSKDEEYFRLVIVGLLCHTEAADILFDGPISRSMDRKPILEDRMFGSLQVHESGVVLDIEYHRVFRIAEKIVRGLEVIETGVPYPVGQKFEVEFAEVEGSQSDAACTPDFTYQPIPEPPGGWEFTLYGSVRFEVWLA